MHSANQDFVPVTSLAPPQTSLAGLRTSIIRPQISLITLETSLALPQTSLALPQAHDSRIILHSILREDREISETFKKIMKIFCFFSVGFIWFTSASFPTVVIVNCPHKMIANFQSAPMWKKKKISSHPFRPFPFKTPPLRILIFQMIDNFCLFSLQKNKNLFPFRFLHLLLENFRKFTRYW